MIRGLAFSIEGVLTPRARDELATLDSAAIARLSRIVDATGAALVCTSAWRLMPQSTCQRVLRIPDFTPARWIQAWMRDAEPMPLWKFKHEIAGVTGLSARCDRGEEIETAMGALGIHRWIAIDDRARLFGATYRDRLVCTAGAGILNDAHADEVIGRLGGAQPRRKDRKSGRHVIAWERDEPAYSMPAVEVA